LFEGSPSFDVIYMNPSGDPRVGGNSATIGVQNGLGLFTQFACNSAALTSGTVLHFTSAAGSGPPVNNLAFAPASGGVGSTFLATSQVTPGCGPPSTGITVSLNATGINSGTIAMHDDGANGDAVAGDNTFSANVTVGAGASVGPHSLTATVRDAQNRTGTASANFSVAGQNDECSGAINAVLGNNPFDNTAATTSSPAAPCGALGNDLWYNFTSPTGGQVTISTCGLTGSDSAVAVYDTDCNTPIACNDDSCGLQSNLTFCAAANHQYKLRIGGFAGNRWVGSFDLSISGGSTSPTVSGAINPTCAGPGSTLTITAQVDDPGCPAQTVVSARADASAVGGGSSVILHDDGVFPDTVGGDNVFTGEATIANGTSGGTYDVPMTVTFSGGPVGTSASVTVTAPYTPPATTVPEGEDCNQIFPDDFNGGCNSTSPVFSNAEFCTDYSGTSANNFNYRDTDWWMFNLATDDDVTVTGQAAFAAQVFFVLPTCPGTLVPGTPVGRTDCAPDFSITFHLTAGPQVFFISPVGWDGSAVCGQNGNYWFRITLASNPFCGPSGACCTNTGCTVMTPAQCQAANGHYNGDGSHCSSCPGTGACCTANGCSIITQAACAASGGTYQGDNSTCPIGAPTDYASDPNLSIPDAGQPVSDSINVGSSYGVAHMGVHVTIPDHTYVQDLTVDLTHGSTTVRLWNLQCGANDGLDVVFDDAGSPVVCGQPTSGTYQPAQPLSAFNGQDASGTWTITVQDHVGQDVGTLTHWDMNINGPGACGPVCDSADFDCDGDTGTDFDIEAFFRCLAGTCPGNGCANDADFNNDGDTGTDADIEAFFRILAGAPC